MGVQRRERRRYGSARKSASVVGLRSGEGVGGGTAGSGSGPFADTRGTLNVAD